VTKQMIYRIVTALVIVVVGGAMLATFESQAQSGQVLVNRNSGKCLDVRGASIEARAPVQQYTCSGGGNQLWQLVAVGNGYYNLVAAHSGMCLDVRGANTASSAEVQQHPCTGGTNQQWSLAQSQEGGYYHLVARHSGMCLDVRAKSKSDRAPVQQYRCNGGKNQRWAIQ
jgi:endoglucanase